MKAQYFGDVNDYRKFALLRLLAEFGGFRIGVCWTLTEPDDTGQGAKREYLGRPEDWRRYHPQIFDALATVPQRPTLPDLQSTPSVLPAFGRSPPGGHVPGTSGRSGGAPACWSASNEFAMNQNDVAVVYK